MLRTATLLTLLTVILLAIGWFLMGIWGMGLFLILAIAINFVSYWYSDRIVLKMYKAKPLDNKKINETIENLCREAKIPEPKLYLIDTNVPNAFATGRNPENAAIAITKGLLDLDKEEIEGVLAHELSHIKSRDILISTIAATIAGAISFIAQIGYFTLFMGGDQKGEGGIIGLILILIFAPLAAFLVRMAISRTREFQADLLGVLMTKNPHALASALTKIHQISKKHPMQGSAATEHLWIENPFRKDWFNSLFATHPPIEKRIKRLETMESKW